MMDERTYELHLQLSVEAASRSYWLLWQAFGGLFNLILTTYKQVKNETMT